MAFPRVVVVCGAAFTFCFFGKRTQQIYVTPLVAWLWHCWISTGDGRDGGGGGGCSRGGVFSLFYLSVALGVVVDGARTTEHGKSHSLTKCEIQKNTDCDVVEKQPSLTHFPPPIPRARQLTTAQIAL